MSVNLKLNLSIVNALWVILTGERFDLEDPELQTIVSKFDAVLRFTGGFGTKDQILMRLSPTLFKKTSKRFALVSNFFEDVRQLVGKPIASHKATIDIVNPRDFIDVYLRQIQNQSDPNSSFYSQRGEESLICNLLDLFLAGLYEL